jgi:hypothetical protein
LAAVVPSTFPNAEAGETFFIAADVLAPLADTIWDLGVLPP